MISESKAACSWRTIFASLCLVGGLLAAAAVPTKSAQAFHDGKDKYLNGQGILWDVVKNEGKPTEQRIYVLGTFHISSREIVNNVPKPVTTAMARSKIGVFESIDDLRMQFGSFGRWYLNDGRTLEMILGAELFNKAKAIAKTENNISPWFLNWLRPWAANMFIGGNRRLRAEARAGKPVLDRSLQYELMRQGRKVFNLETTAQQLAAFEIWPEVEQIKFLKHYVDNFSREKSEIQLRKMSAFYIKRDLDGLHAYSKETSVPEDANMAEYAKFWEMFLDWRNEYQVDQALKIYAREGGPIFMAIGAAHLPGQRGVINTLVKKGFKAKRLH